MLKTLLGLYCGASAMFTLAAGMLDEASLGTFANLGSTALLAWYLYYDVAIARPKRDTAIESSITHQNDFTERMLRVYREDTAEQIQRTSTYYERIITELKEAAVDRRRQSGSNRMDKETS